MVQQKIIHRRRDDSIYVPLMGADADFVGNFEWRVAHAIAQGYRRDGLDFPPPPAVLRLIARWEAEHGPLRRTAKGEPVDLFSLPECALKRAALTTADDLAGDEAQLR